MSEQEKAQARILILENKIATTRWYEFKKRFNLYMEAKTLAEKHNIKF